MHFIKRQTNARCIARGNVNIRILDLSSTIVFRTVHEQLPLYALYETLQIKKLKTRNYDDKYLFFPSF